MPTKIYPHPSKVNETMLILTSEISKYEIIWFKKKDKFDQLRPNIATLCGILKLHPGYISELSFNTWFKEKYTEFPDDGYYELYCYFQKVTRSPKVFLVEQEEGLPFLEYAIGEVNGDLIGLKSK